MPGCPLDASCNILLSCRDEVKGFRLIEWVPVHVGLEVVVGPGWDRDLAKKKDPRATEGFPWLGSQSGGIPWL